MRVTIKLIGSKTGAPVSGATLVFLDPVGNRLTELQTDAGGAVVLDSEFDAALLVSGNYVEITAPGFNNAGISTDMLLNSTTLKLIEKTDVFGPLVLGLGLGIVSFWFYKNYRNG